MTDAHEPGTHDAQPTDAGLSSKPRWQLARDTHGLDFPDSLRNWLALDYAWAAQTEDIVAAVLAVARGEEPDTHAFDRVRRLSIDDIDQQWTIDDPVVLQDLPEDHEWLLLLRDPEQLTVMTLYPEGFFDRVYWESDLAGDSLVFLVGRKKQPVTTQKTLHDEDE